MLWNEIPSPRDWLAAMTDLSLAAMTAGWRSVSGASGTFFEAPDLVPSVLNVMHVGARTASVMPLAGMSWTDLANKLEATGDFLGGGRTVPRSLASGGLWATEATGYRTTLAWSAMRREAGPWLHEGAAESRALLPLHTGAGLALASRFVRELPLRASDAYLEEALSGFAEDCRRFARSGFFEAVFEALGFVVHNVQPQSRDRINSALEHLDGKLVDLFWHGCGRGLYFSPFLAWPGSWGHALERLERRSLSGPSRNNYKAGYAWALALVNRRHPDVIARFVVAHRKRVAADPSFVNGIVGAFLIARGFGQVPRESTGFLETCNVGDRSTETWRRLVVDPCRQADALLLDELRRTEAWGSLFRVGNVPDES